MATNQTPDSSPKTGQGSTEPQGASTAGKPGTQLPLPDASAAAPAGPRSAPAPAAGSSAAAPAGSDPRSNAPVSKQPAPQPERNAPAAASPRAGTAPAAAVTPRSATADKAASPARSAAAPDAAAPKAAPKAASPAARKPAATARKATTPARKPATSTQAAADRPASSRKPAPAAEPAATRAAASASTRQAAAAASASKRPEQPAASTTQTPPSANDLWQQFAGLFQAFQAPGVAMPAAGTPWPAQQPPSLRVDPQAAAALQHEFGQRFNEMFRQYSAGAAPTLKDNRFSAPAWQEKPMFGWQAAWYLFNSEFLRRAAELVQTDSKTRDRLRFLVQQWIDAMSPANYLATNPEAQQLAIDSQGESLRKGMDNFLKDMQQGRISQTDLDAFEIGRNVCTTPGTVVFENELVQLIQYTPTTAKVGERPLLIVPPAINKFYILDLQPANSFIGHAVAEGNTVFVISWRNIKDHQCTLGWDDYLQTGIVDVIRVVQDISGQPTMNMLGFCIGGTLLSTTLAALAAKGERPAASLTLLTTLLDFSNPGILGIFIDEMQIALREQTIGKQGIMPGKDLALTFSFLRPNELVWNYVVGNYLKGESPPAFDLLYWNSDSTNLAGPMFCTYLRHLYLQNELSSPGRFTSLGEPIDLSAIDVPTYVLCAREDHIVPWKGGYESARALGGDPRFVLAASGHIAGVINPPAKQKRSYATGPSIDGLAPDEWLADTETHAGSWWPDWYAWLRPFQGRQVPVPSRPGNARHQPIEPAPGRYVKEKV